MKININENVRFYPSDTDKQIYLDFAKDIDSNPEMKLEEDGSHIMSIAFFMRIYGEHYRLGNSVPHTLYFDDYADKEEVSFLRNKAFEKENKDVTINQLNVTIDTLVDKLAHLRKYCGL